MNERVDLDAMEADMAALDFSHSLGVPEVSQLIAELRRLRPLGDAAVAWGNNRGGEGAARLEELFWTAVDEVEGRS